MPASMSGPLCLFHDTHDKKRSINAMASLFWYLPNLRIYELKLAVS